MGSNGPARSRRLRIASGVVGDRAVEVTAAARMLDGRLVSLRRLNAGDSAAVLTLHQHLSDHDRYFRFFTLQPVQLHELVGKLTEPAEGLYALGAFDAGRLIGVAHYVVVDDPKVAEVAVVVAHEDHSLGVGTALIKQLGSIARAHGIGSFVADVLGENHLMLAVFFDLGWRCKPAGYGSIRHLEVELPEFNEEPPPAVQAQ